MGSETARRAAADDAFEAYDFEPGYVEAANGWETNDDDEWTRKVFYRHDTEAETEMIAFCVRFNGETVTDAWVSGWD